MWNKIQTKLEQNFKLHSFTRTTCYNERVIVNIQLTKLQNWSKTQANQEPSSRKTQENRAKFEQN